MPIMTRQPEATDSTATHPADVQRHGGRPVGNAGRDDPGAVRLAYALRWLELGDGDARAIWPTTVDRERV